MNNVVVLGSNYFPTGGADSTKTTLVCKSILLTDRDVLVLNRFGNIDSNKHKLTKTGIFEGVKYLFCASPFRHKNIVIRNINKIFGLIKELIILMRLRYSKSFRIAVINTPYFSRLLYYSILSRIIRFKVVYIQSELYSFHNNSPFNKTNNYLLDKCSFFFIDGLLPISQFIIKNATAIKPTIKYLKIPVLADFSKFIETNNHNNNNNNNNNKPYFIYCAAFGYLNSYELILKAFDEIENNLHYLILVGYGSCEQRNKISNIISTMQYKNKVQIWEDIPYHELVSLYKNSDASLLPLENTNRDIARFPQKVAEYCASGKTIITNKIGEIDYYFKDNETALFAKSNDIHDFSQKMKWVIENPDSARQIGNNSLNLGIKYFDYKVYSNKLEDFFCQL